MVPGGSVSSRVARPPFYKDIFYLLWLNAKKRGFPRHPLFLCQFITFNSLLLGFWRVCYWNTVQIFKGLRPWRVWQAARVREPPKVQPCLQDRVWTFPSSALLSWLFCFVIEIRDFFSHHLPPLIHVTWLSLVYSRGCRQAMSACLLHPVSLFVPHCLTPKE